MLRDILGQVVTWAKRYIYAEKIGGHTLINGLEEVFDHRIFKTSVLGLGAYAPQSVRKVIQTISIKFQGQYGTCQWNATTAQKEVDEKVPLSVESLVAYASTKGLVGANGISNLQDGQKAVQDFGIAEDSFLPNPPMTDFQAYVSANRVLTPDVISNAAKHKSKTFWQVIGRDDTLRLLDQGKVLTTGIMWYSGFNMGGGFTAPWLIRSFVGTAIEGHAFIMIGYDLNYLGRKVYIFQNSYGPNWGDSGKFYIDMDFFDQYGYSRFASLDISYDIGAFLNAYDGKNVRGDNAAIYFIEDGKKRAFPDWLTFLAYGNLKGSWDKVDQATLDQVPTGDPMDITQSSNWALIKDVAAPDNMHKLLEILTQSK